VELNRGALLTDGWQRQCAAVPCALDCVAGGSPGLSDLRVDWPQRHELLRARACLQRSLALWAAGTLLACWSGPQEFCPRRDEPAAGKVLHIRWVASRPLDGGLAVADRWRPGCVGPAAALGCRCCAPQLADLVRQGVQRLRIASAPGRVGVGARPAGCRRRCSSGALWLGRPAGMAAGGGVAAGFLDWAASAGSLVALRPVPGPGALLQLTAQNLFALFARPWRSGEGGQLWGAECGHEATVALGGRGAGACRGLGVW